VNCPMVPINSSLAGGEKNITLGWYQNKTINYIDFGINTAYTITIYVLPNVSGQYNIIPLVPGQSGYTAFWNAALYNAPSGYVANTWKSSSDLLKGAVGSSIDGPTAINCPVVFVGNSTSSTSGTSSGSSSGSSTSSSTSSSSSSSKPFTAADLEVLRQWDTPTICNGLELCCPSRRALGFTTKHMFVADPKLKPICGLSRTACIRARDPPKGAVADRADYYAYVESSDKNSNSLPTVVVIQDLDSTPGFGAWWGEVNTTVHLNLGVEGCVTNGSFRDLDMLAKGFQIIGGNVGPSHAFVHVTQFKNDVDIYGMTVCHDDVIHADLHGAVIIPDDCVKKLPAAIDLCMRREKVILDMAKAPGFNADKMRQALKTAGEIH